MSMSTNGTNSLGVQAAFITPNPEPRVFGQAKTNTIRNINQIAVEISLVVKIVSTNTPDFSKKPYHLFLLQLASYLHVISSLRVLELQLG
jgi:dynactin complex subunit